MLNHPYSKFVSGRDPMAMLEETPKRLNDLAQKMGESGFEKRYAPGKWTGRFIVAHLADCEVAFGFRWRQAAFSPGVGVQPFDQEAWAQNYDRIEAKWALGAFQNARFWNLEFLKALPKEAFANKAVHPERGEMTLQDMITLAAGHDINHLQQLETLAGAR